MSVLTVALDAMGGDFGPSETVPAAAQALSLLPKLNILLVGDQNQLVPLLQQHTLSSHPRLHLVHASQSVSMAERPVIALRNKKYDIAFLDISMPGKTGLDLLKLLPGLEAEIIFVTAFDNFAVSAFSFRQ